MRVVALTKPDMSNEQDIYVLLRANLENERRLILSRARWIEQQMGIVSEEDKLREVIRKLETELAKYR
jgi:hypothetical protein